MANLNNEDLELVDSWVEASKNSKGYQDRHLVLNLIEQFKNDLNIRDYSNPGGGTLRLQQLLLGFFLSTKNLNQISVGDYGGANGYMCDWLRHFNPDVDIIYTVFEPKVISDAYNVFAKQIGINFVDISHFNAYKFDLIIISGTLQYTQNWQEVLATSLKNAKYVLIMRIPLIKSFKDEYLIQRGTTGLYSKTKSSWPVIFFSRTGFIANLEKTATIKWSAKDYEESFPFKGETYFYETFLLQRKN